MSKWRSYSMNCCDGIQREIASCTVQSVLYCDDVQLAYPLHLHTNSNKVKRYTTIYAILQSVGQFRLKSDAVWSSLESPYHHRWLLIGQRRLPLQKYKFHILASLMACPTALPKFSELTTDNTLLTSLRTSESYDVWPLHKISMASMVACNLYFLNSLFRQHIFSLRNVYRTKA